MITDNDYCRPGSTAQPCRLCGGSGLQLNEPCSECDGNGGERYEWVLQRWHPFVLAAGGLFRVGYWLGWASLRIQRLRWKLLHAADRRGIVLIRRDRGC